MLFALNKPAPNTQHHQWKKSRFTWMEGPSWRSGPWSRSRLRFHRGVAPPSEARLITLCWRCVLLPQSGQSLKPLRVHREPRDSTCLLFNFLLTFRLRRLHGTNNSLRKRWPLKGPWEVQSAFHRASTRPFSLEEPIQIWNWARVIFPPRVETLERSLLNIHQP